MLTSSKPFPLARTKRPVLLAHRGAAEDGVPENSRAAFDAAFSSGKADGLETDVHATADGYPVLSHDKVWYATDGNFEIADMTWEQLSRHRLSNGEKPLGFEEFLDRYPGIYLNIDAKSDAVVPAIVATLRNRTDLGRLGLGSFSTRRVWQLSQALGDEPGYLIGATDILRLVVLVAGGVTPGRWLTPRLVRDYNCAAAVPVSQYGIPIVTRRFVAAAHRLGCPVYVWTINDPVEFLRLHHLGIDGVYTDNVFTLSRVATKDSHRF